MFPFSLGWVGFNLSILHPPPPLHPRMNRVKWATGIGKLSTVEHRRRFEIDFSVLTLKKVTIWNVLLSDKFVPQPLIAGDKRL